METGTELRRATADQLAAIAGKAVECILSHEIAFDVAQLVLQEKTLFDSGIRDLLDGFRPFTHDKTKEGWTLLEDVDFSPRISSFRDLELVAFLQEGESYISGEKLSQRAKEELMANLGQRHAEYLLQHQEGIPKEWRSYYLVFPGTVWRRPGGRRCVPYLYWFGGRWYLSFVWRDGHFSSRGRLVRPRE